MSSSKSILITGGGSGIGLEIARLLASREHSLILFGRDSVRLQAAANELRATHGTTPVLGAFVYASPLRENATFVAIVQWGVFPVVAGSGLLMWSRPWLARRAAKTKSP